jgi:cytochrome c oxidase subunit III
VTVQARPAPHVLGEQYQSLEQQHATAEFGMWIFLATEVMLFGGLFTAYTFYRIVYPDGFAEGSRHLDLAIAGPNTAVLIVSSLTMALAVRAAQLGERRKTTWYLIATLVLGVVFMVLKGVEYYQHFLEGMVPGLAWTYAEPEANAVQLFFVAYFTMTGLHAIHLLVAIGIVCVCVLMARRGAYLPAERHTSLEMVGLYWHFVDMIWAFLLPLLYLFGFHP